MLSASCTLKSIKYHVLIHRVVGERKTYFYNLMAFTFRQFFCIFVQTTGKINITALLKLGEPGGPTALCTLYDRKLAPKHTRAAAIPLPSRQISTTCRKSLSLSGGSKEKLLVFYTWLQGWNANFATE